VSSSGEPNCKWAGRYEALRAHATGEAPLDFVPLGLALLRHRGVTAWMAAERSLLGPERPPRARRTGPARVPEELDGFRPQLVRLLAGTALLVAQGRTR
jgi:hypothetical protein